MCSTDFHLYYVVSSPTECLLNNNLIITLFNHPADPRHDIINHPNGSFDGKPAFLGYFFPVLLIFLIYTRDLSISVSGSLNLSTFSITPPRILTAFFDFSTSASTSPDLYATNIHLSSQKADYTLIKPQGQPLPLIH